MVIPICRGVWQSVAIYHMQCKIRDSISKEVILRLKLNDKKKPSMQRFWGEAEEIISTKAWRQINLGHPRQRKSSKVMRSENKANVGSGREKYFIETANEDPNPDGHPTLLSLCFPLYQTNICDLMFFTPFHNVAPAQKPLPILVSPWSSLAHSQLLTFQVDSYIIRRP